MAKTCPNCHTELEDGARFCGSCGRQTAVAESEDAALDIKAFAKPFSIRLAHPAAFCVGRRSPVEIAFRAGEDVFSSVSFQLACADREVAAGTLIGRPGVDEKRILLQVTPTAAGGAALELRASLLADGVREPEVHATRFIMPVDDPQGRGPTVFAPNITPNSDRAGHIEIGAINLNMAEGGFGIKPADAIRYETLLPAEEMPTDLLSSPSKLTLRTEGGRTIQLLSDEEITFGRNRDNVVVSRIFGPDGCLDRPANEGNISRFHFKLVRRKRGAYAVDLGSTNGTRLNGCGISSPEGQLVDSERESLLSVGCEGRALDYEVHPYANGWKGLAGFVLKRRDSAPEQVVVVWGGRIPFADGAFLRDGGRWIFRRASGESVGLGLTTRVEIGGRSMRVLPYHQPFV